MKTNIALVGNPNCGKTTLFNALTGANQYVGNWPGVTVEKKTGKLKGHDSVELVDLPGIYSLSPYTLEEVVARDYLIDEHPQAVINIVDGSNLERNLYLSTQVLELGLPTVMAVNMADVLKKTGDRIDCEALSAAMGCPVVEISALKGTGIDDLIERIVDLSAGNSASGRAHHFAEGVESALAQIEDGLTGLVPDSMKRFFAVKVLERDEKIADRLKTAPRMDDIIAQLEEAEDDDSESIIVNERYGYISRIIDECLTKSKKDGVSLSDKIDSVVTNRILALPIFAAVIFLVYYLSITTVGTAGTDWVNDNLFGEGFFVGAANTEEFDEASGDYTLAQSEIDAYIAAAAEQGIELEVEAGEEGYDAALTKFAGEAEAAGVTAHVDNYDDETGENEAIEVDAAVFAEAQEVEEPDPNQYGMWVPSIPAAAESAMAAIDVHPQVQGLVLDGIIGGVGAVLGFVPQMLVLFFLLAFLEGCGYMSRIAFILDRVFRRFGLSGKSFIPMLIGTGCGVPAVMASRTIESEADRRMTVMTTTFMPCSAKLPIIALISGAVFGGVWWVAPSAYFLGIAAILCSGIILKKTKPFAGKAAPFVMELPAYHMPTLGSLLRSMWERAWSFIKKAGTIILLAAILIWFLSGYGFTADGFGPVDDQNASLLAMFGGALAWIFIPQGFGTWQATAATFTGLIAKENVVGTFGVLYAGDAGWFANVQAAFTAYSGYAFLAFNLLCAPCFAAIGAIRKEMNSAAWFWRAIGYECGFAYVVSMVIYQLGGLIGGEVSFNIWTVVAIAAVCAFIFLMLRPTKHDDDAVVLSVNADKAAA